MPNLSDFFNLIAEEKKKNKKKIAEEKKKNKEEMDSLIGDSFNELFLDKIKPNKNIEKQVENKVVNENVIPEGLLNILPNENNSDPLTPLNQNFATLDDLQNHYKLFLNRIQQELSTIGGGGEVRFEFLDDVDRATAKTNDSYLKYDATLNKWVGDSAGFITTSFTNTNQLTNGAGFITTSFTNTNQLTNGAGFITATSSGTGLTGIVTSIIAGTNVTISGSTGEVTINSSGGSSGIEIENNGTSVGTGITSINFSTNVTATASGGIATVTASGGGGGSSVAIIDEVETFSTGGGSFTSGAWQDRDLNTVTYDGDDIIDLNSSTGEVTLKAAGTYKIDFRAPGNRCDHHVTRILDTSITLVRGRGSTEYSQDLNPYAQTNSMGSTIYTTTDVNQKFKLQHRCTTTQSSAFGMGSPHNTSAIGNNYYSQVIVTKLS